MGTEPSMGTDATRCLNGNTALPLVRVRSRADDAAAAGSTTPSLHTPVTVPFLWEDAPGKPKPHSATVVPAAADGGDKKSLRLMPLKLPPRLQVPSSAAADSTFSPKTVLHGPYYGCTGGARKPPPPRRAASFRRTPGAGIFFSRRMKAGDKKKGGRGHDAAGLDTSSSSSPSPSSSSSSSVSFFGDDSRGPGARRLPGDEKCTDQTAEDGSARGLVRITRFRRNSSLPSMSITTSHLWASFRKSVKQIAPWT